MRNIIFIHLLLLAACSSPAPSGERTSAQQTSTLEERVDVKPILKNLPPSPVMPKTAEPFRAGSAAKAHSETAPAASAVTAFETAAVNAPGAPVTEASGGPVKPVTQMWHLQKGKLTGPGAFGHASQISKVKNKKTPGFTIETCYRYATFAIVEMRSTDEIGAAEVTLRQEPPKGFALCQPEFKGKTTNLKIIEGYFAGVAGGYIMIDGADSSEGQTEFQLIDVNTGLEVMKSVHHPKEDFAIIKVGDATTLEFYAKLAVKCELAAQGEACWKKVLSENKVVGKTPKPDCPSDPALVFTRARVNKPGSPIKFLGGKSTCQAAP